jgi:hypothetical protein
MGRWEYRIERLPVEDDHDSRLLGLVERLNELGAEGWRVASVDLTPHPAFRAAPLPVLLEREATAPGAAARGSATGTTLDVGAGGEGRPR